MLRWLSGTRNKSRDLVTDDPLAAIYNQRRQQVYSVTRVNPIFIEEDERRNTKCICSGDQHKSGSSGYESQRSNSEWSVEEDRGVTRLREDAVAILEQNPGFVKSILVAVRGGPTLSPIPEGKIDYCIPRPVWPRYEHRQRKPPAVRANDVYTGLRVNKTARVHRKTQRKAIQNRQMDTAGGILEEEQKTTRDILRELSNTISLAVDKKDNSEISAEEVLRSIGQTISKSLEALSSEAALRRLSVSLSRSDAVATVGRALSNSGSSTDGCDIEAGRLSLLKRLGRFPPTEPLYDHPQGSSSSSASSSGFSDLTPTPPSSSSSRPLGPVFVHENLASVPNSVRNAMIYGSVQSKGTRGKGYEKLGEGQVQDTQWTTFKETAAPEKTETEICVFPGCRGPDFTLDVQQAAELMHRLKVGKRQRCWCRIITSLLGFFFFLFSVMLVSMLLTRGKRVFGSL